MPGGPANVIDLRLRVCERCDSHASPWTNGKTQPGFPLTGRLCRVNSNLHSHVINAELADCVE